MQTSLQAKPRPTFLFLTEAFCWVIGIVLLAFLDPTHPHVFSLCPFSWVFASGCPGCGLGHAVAFLVRGEIAASWEAHPLGLPALILLAARVSELVKNYRCLKKYTLNQE